MPGLYRPLWPVNPGRALKERDKFGAYRQGGRKHAGIDIYAPEGTNVKASLDGKVVRATGEGGHATYGGLVIIDHTPDIKTNVNPTCSHSVYTLYAHLKTVKTSLRGQMVRRGDVVGTVGNTGNAKTMKPHLHFETIRADIKLTWNPYENTGIVAGRHRINPMGFLRGFSLPEECFESLSFKEMDRFHIGTRTYERDSRR